MLPMRTAHPQSIRALLTTSTTITKDQAASQLLHSAIDAFLDRQDFLAALVLGGAAEDVLEGVLARRGRPSSRDELLNLAHAVDGSARSRRSPFYTLSRSAYNWPRHNDDPDDPQEVTEDWQSAAAEVLGRAAVNLVRVTGEWPARWSEMDDRRGGELGKTPGPAAGETAGGGDGVPR